MVVMTAGSGTKLRLDDLFLEALDLVETFAAVDAVHEDEKIT